MSCSKQSAVNYLISKKLVKPNMELYNSLPTKRLSDTIDWLTKLAKDKYGVDMGKLFGLQFRDTIKGNPLTIGSAAVVSKAKLEPNNAAFEAIDRSNQQTNNKLEAEMLDQMHEKMGDYTVTYIDPDTTQVVNSDGSINGPSSLPKINVRC